MSDIMAEEATDIYSVIDSVKDEGRKRELRVGDEEEDFLNEGFSLLNSSSLPFLFSFHSFKDDAFIRLDFFRLLLVSRA